MLPTNKKAENCILIHEGTYRRHMYWNKHYMTQEYLRNENLTSHHLYIISDEEIKEGDWILTKDYGIWQYKPAPCPLPYWGNKNECKKIIATTDKLVIDVFSKDELYPNNTEEVFLPNPSQSFINKFINEYNKGNIITDVMVEYEELVKIPQDHILTGSDVEKECIKHSFYHPKISSDNTITIKKIKDSWNREEVIKFVGLYSSYKTREFTSDDLQWVKNNLY